MKLFEDGDPFFAPMLNALFAAFRGTAVMSGCEVSATGTSRTVSITAGSVQINGEVIAVSAGSVTLDAGSTFDRYDLVSVNASGSKIVTKGTTKRKCPTQPADTCLLAIVFVPAGATVIATGDVSDARMLTEQVAMYRALAGQLTASRIYADNLYYRRITPTASDTPVVSRTGARPGGRSGAWGVTDTITIPPGYNAGSVRVSCWVVWSHHIAYQIQAQILKNGDVVAEMSETATSVHEYLTADISISPGDVITIRGSTSHPNVNMQIEDVQVGATLTYEGIDTAYSTTISIA